MSNWMATSWRNLFFDYHTHSSASSVMSDFVPDEWASTLVDMDVEAVSVFAVDAFGWRFYRRGKLGWVHPQLPEGRDLLGETVEACRRRGIRTIAYFNTMNSEPVAAHHPEWLELDQNGVPKNDYDIYQEMVICWLGDSVEQLFIPQLEELVSNYQLDGLFFDGTYAHSPCYCGNCVQNYRAFSGHDIPVDPDDAGWQEWVAWAEGRWMEIRRRILEVVGTKSPDTLVCFNWGYTTRRPEPVADGVGFLTLDLFPQNQVRDGGYQAKWFSSRPVPYSIMNTAFTGWWGDRGLKPLRALEQEIGVALIHGAKTWLGYQLEPSHQLRTGVKETLGAAMAFVREREAHLPAPGGLLSDVAILHCSDIYATRPAEKFTDETLADQFPVGTYQLGRPAIFADETSLRGAHQAVLRAGLTSQFLSERELLERIDDFRTVVIADQRHLPAALIQRIDGWVRAGGSLIVTHKSGTLAASGKVAEQWALAELTGTQLLGEDPYPMSYVEPIRAGRWWDGIPDLPILARVPATQVRATEATELSKLRQMYVRSDGQALLRTSPPGALTSYSSVTLHRLGNGAVLYSAIDIFSAASRANQWALERLASNALMELTPTPRARVVTPGWEITTHDDDTYSYVHGADNLVTAPPQRTNAFAAGSITHPFEVLVPKAARGEASAFELLPAGQLTVSDAGESWFVRYDGDLPQVSIRWRR